jgi:hypothetical protein
MMGIDRVAKKLFVSQEGSPFNGVFQSSTSHILAVSFTPLKTGSNYLISTEHGQIET